MLNRQITTTRVDSLSFDLFIWGAGLVLGFGDGVIQNQFEACVYLLMLNV
jgi:hypothetical protein